MHDLFIFIYYLSKYDLKLLTLKIILSICRNRNKQMLSANI